MQADMIPATTVVGIGEVIPISATSFVRNTYTLPDITPATESTPKPRKTPPMEAVKPKRWAFFMMRAKAFQADLKKLLLVSAI